MRRPTLLALSIVFASQPSIAADDLSELMSMSLEDLAMLDVTMETASKFSQELSDIPAAVYVLDGERIMRSGVRSIAEALMLVPGLNVTKFSETEFFVSARGFHDGLYNKMLVMMDGRSLFSPVYGGVYWTDIDYVLQDIDRIEVLRGPGGSIWGGNAVNGVINIITKKSSDTLGSYAQGTYADGGDYSASARHGFTLDNGIEGRVYVKAKESQSLPEQDYYVRQNQSFGLVLEESLDTAHWRFRAGAEQDGFDMPLTYYQFTDQGSTGYRQTMAEVESHSAYLQLELDLDSDALQSNYSIWAQRYEDEALDAPARYTTFDLDASFAWSISDEDTLLFGGGYRLVDIDFTHTYSNTNLYDIPSYIRVSKTSREVDSIVNGFVQLQNSWSERLSTVAGLKVEYFEHTYETALSPQLSANYQINSRHSVWAGMAKANVAPSYMNTNTDYYSVYYWDGSHYISASYSADLEMESVTSHEIGYRYDGDRFELDVTLFTNQHENVRGTEFISYGAVFDVNVINDHYEATSYGLEVASGVEVTERWQLYGSYTYFSLDESLTEAPMGEAQENYYDIEHQHLFTLQSLWTINPQWQFDLLLKGQILQYAPEYEDPASSFYSHVPNYMAVDARVSWQRTPSWPQVELVMQNVGEKEGYVADFSQYSSGHRYEQQVYVRLSHEF